MGGKEAEIKDFYAVLGLKKECTEAELKNAYKKLAMRWHPDRCSASGNIKFVDEAKMKFQSIQEAYSVLSDSNKRFLYDVGMYDEDDADQRGMGDFMSEMAAMMTQTKPNENGKESFEQLQELFEEMFKGEVESFNSSSHHPAASSSYCSNNKRSSLDMTSGRATSSGESSAFSTCFQNFHMGAEQQEKRRARIGQGTSGGIRGGGRRHKASPRHDLSSNDFSSIST